jgi:hypothetical protein
MAVGSLPTSHTIRPKGIAYEIKSETNNVHKTALYRQNNIFLVVTRYNFLHIIDDGYITSLPHNFKARKIQKPSSFFQSK